MISCQVLFHVANLNALVHRSYLANLVVDFANFRDWGYVFVQIVSEQRQYEII